MSRGVLRVYLGAAPGVGKTFAMLDEGHRRRERGGDVVVAFVETHGRARTRAQLRDLEIVPRRAVEHRGAVLDEMDVDAVLARRPTLALVDELAHSNVAGSRNAKRWQDVEELLDVGIDVITTLNVQHLESHNHVVDKITGVVQRETVPDAVVRRADQIELVDMSPEALRRRMAHGNIYPAERIEAALANYFRPGNLGALRELALLWAADRVEDALVRYRSSAGITDTWETRERVAVAVTGSPGGAALVRRAARIASRARGELLGVHVVASDGLREQTGTELARHRELVVELGGSYLEVVGDDVGRALVDAARSRGATQLVLGASRRSRLGELVRGSVISDTIRRADGIDVHVIAADDTGPRRLPRRPRWRSPIPVRRQLAGWVIVAAGLPVLTALLAAQRGDLSLATDLLLMLGVVVAGGALGGPAPGLVGALAGSLLVNFYLVEPVHTFTIGERENLVALVVFVAVAATVSMYVHLAARRTIEARRARAEAQALSRSAGTLAASADPLPALLAQLREAFGATHALLRARRSGGWEVLAEAGEPPATGASPADRSETSVLQVGGDNELVLTGPPLGLEDRVALRTHADQLAVGLRTRALHEGAARAEVVREADALRTALLQAVSHDLRTPLASIKASVTSLLSSDIDWAEAERRDFLLTVDAETDRLTRLVGNLLDMSRLQAGVLTLHRAPTAIDDVIANALASLSHVPDDLVVVDVPDHLPLVDVDPELLERAVANVVGNAVGWSPAGQAVRVEGACADGRVHLRVVDRGPGIPDEARDAARRPFQRLGDGGQGSAPAGVGLGLAVATGFVTAMGGRLALDDTPGGGLTVDIDLAVSGETDPMIEAGP